MLQQVFEGRRMSEVELYRCVSWASQLLCQV